MKLSNRTRKVMDIWPLDDYRVTNREGVMTYPKTDGVISLKPYGDLLTVDKSKEVEMTVRSRPTVLVPEYPLPPHFQPRPFQREVIETVRSSVFEPMYKPYRSIRSYRVPKSIDIIVSKKPFRYFYDTHRLQKLVQNRTKHHIPVVYLEEVKEGYFRRLDDKWYFVTIIGKK